MGNVMLGKRIRVHQGHWARAKHEGVVVAVDDDKYTIRFDTPGIGFDGGVHLILRENSFEVVPNGRGQRKVHGS